jgi:competence protein ComEA
MKNIRLLITSILLMLLPLTTFANDDVVKTDKYDGIEITVNINQASADELATMLIGVGSEKAKLIVEYRTQHGQFNHADDLSLVKGIGPATVEKNRSRILL